MVLKPILIYMDFEVIERLREIAYQKNTTVSEIVRRAVNQYLSSMSTQKEEEKKEEDNPKIKEEKERIVLNIGKEAWEKNRNVGVKCFLCDTYFHDKPIIMLRKYARHLVQRHGVTNTILTLECEGLIVAEIDLDKIEVS